MSGKKGRSGRKSKRWETLHYDTQIKAERKVNEALDSLPLKEAALLGLPIYLKSIPNKEEQRIQLIPSHDQAVLQRYTELPSPNIDFITGSTASPTDINGKTE